MTQRQADFTYFDTGSGSPLSTNMYAYCDNNPVYKMDKSGMDAIWIQAPSSAKTMGHTSAIFEEKTNHWWYFYWGPNSVQILFLGVFSKKYLNRNITRIINVYNKIYPNLKIKHTDTYSKGLRFKGRFYKPLKNIFIFFYYYIQYIYKLRFKEDNYVL